MRTRIDPATFNRLLIERGLTVKAFRTRSGLSAGTLAKIRRGEAVEMRTITQAAATFKRFRVHPEISTLVG